jgi:hypothetical protein
MPYKFSVRRNNIPYLNCCDFSRTAFLAKNVSVDDPRDANALIVVYEIRHRLSRTNANRRKVAI